MYEVRVKDIATGELLYRHNFKDGMGDWKLYPRCIGGGIEGGALRISAADAFNGYYLDGNYSNCEVEVDFRPHRRQAELHRRRRREGRGRPRHEVATALRQLPVRQKITRGTTSLSISASDFMRTVAR